MKSTYDLYWDTDTSHPSITLVEYIKLHILSLEQDMEKCVSEDDVDYIEINASLCTSRHILSVAYDILGIQTEET